MTAPARECQPGRAEGISALAHYVAMRYAQPLLSLGDSIHSIHLSTEFEAEIKFCDLVEAVNSHATLQARVEELTRALEWQPISTAPRDGSWIVALCNDGTQIFHVYWQADQESWYGHQGAYGDGLFAPHGGWMPAPAPRSAADLLASTISLEDRK